MDIHFLILLLSIGLLWANRKSCTATKFDTCVVSIKISDHEWRQLNNFYTFIVDGLTIGG